MWTFVNYMLAIGYARANEASRWAKNADGMETHNDSGG